MKKLETSYYRSRTAEMLKRIRRDAHAFRLTPWNHLQWLRHRPDTRVVANSVPKAGTNLLVRALYLHEGFRRKPIRTINNDDTSTLHAKLRSVNRGEVVAAHLYYSAPVHEVIQNLDLKHVLLVRDPRDIALSNFHYITYADSKHRLHNHFHNRLRTDEERLHAAIVGVPGSMLADGEQSLGLAQHLDNYLKWLSSDCLLIRFEELVGARGGASETQQHRCLRALFSHVGVDCPTRAIERISAELYSHTSRTFFKGQIGRWREEFSPRLRSVSDQLLGEHIEQLGYDRS